MKKRVVYVHGMGGSAEEAGHYRALFPDCEVIGMDYRAQTPWEAEQELPPFLERCAAGCDSLCLIANSIGAFFAMSAHCARLIDEAFLISPLVDMEKLIEGMMRRAGVTEAALREQKEIQTDFGQTLSWEYLCYVRRNPIVWTAPTHILYGEGDELTSLETVTAFAERTGAVLTVMKGGEHWFHTPEQMAFLDEWLRHAARK